MICLLDILLVSEVNHKLVYEIEGVRARGGVVVEKAPLAGFGLSCLLRQDQQYRRRHTFTCNLATRRRKRVFYLITYTIDKYRISIQQRQHSISGTSQNQHIFGSQCSTSANAQPPQFSPPRHQTSRAEAPSNPFTLTRNPSSRPSTPLPQNQPLLTQIRPHTSTSARENDTAIIALMPKPFTVRLLLAGSAPLFKSLTPLATQLPPFSVYTKHSVNTPRRIRV